VTASLGYGDPAYAASLNEFGTPRELPHSGAWILEREVPRSEALDATGCYPLFSCRSWSGVSADIDTLRGHLLSLVIVTDPFAPEAPEALAAAGADVLRPFKDHQIIDLTLPMDRIGQRSRRRSAARALRRLEVAVNTPTPTLAAQWVELYARLVTRYQIRGISAFSPASLMAQLEVPGAALLTASRDDTLLAAQVCLPQGDAVHCHLAASTDEGYEAGAPAALDLLAIEHYRDSHHWLDLGGGAGIEPDPTDGLSRYKASWATEARPTWLAGFILDAEGYAATVDASGSGSSTYFPAYRAGEFRAGIRA